MYASWHGVPAELYGKFSICVRLNKKPSRKMTSCSRNKLHREECGSCGGAGPSNTSSIEKLTAAIVFSSLGSVFFRPASEGPFTGSTSNSQVILCTCQRTHQYDKMEHGESPLNSYTAGPDWNQGKDAPSSCWECLGRCFENCSFELIRVLSPRVSQNKTHILEYETLIAVLVPWLSREDVEELLRLDSSTIMAASWAGSELMEASPIAEAIVLMLSKRLLDQILRFQMEIAVCALQDSSKRGGRVLKKVNVHKKSRESIHSYEVIDIIPKQKTLFRKTETEHRLQRLIDMHQPLENNLFPVLHIKEGMPSILEVVRTCQTAAEKEKEHQNAKTISEYNTAVGIHFKGMGLKSNVGVATHSHFDKWCPGGSGWARLFGEGWVRLQSQLQVQNIVNNMLEDLHFADFFILRNTGHQTLESTVAVEERALFDPHISGLSVNARRTSAERDDVLRLVMCGRKGEAPPVRGFGCHAIRQKPDYLPSFIFVLNVPAGSSASYTECRVERNRVHQGKTKLSYSCRPRAQSLSQVQDSVPNGDMEGVGHTIFGRKIPNAFYETTGSDIVEQLNLTLDSCRHLVGLSGRSREASIIQTAKPMTCGDVTASAGGKVDGQNGDPVPELQMYDRKKGIPAGTRLVEAQTHPVRFESILEGVYGPRLLQDLSIFDECEPEAVDDWSVDENCSFCNLQLEKLNEYPTMAVPGSPPSAETPPPQGLSNSDKLLCQADQFLYAVFRKRELPQSCDSSIPLVAQELMRRMIQQFALEYATKSQPHMGFGGSSDDSELNHQDTDGPLDLTVSRTSPIPQDGVLDLSKKNTPSEKETKQRKVSDSLGGNVEDQSRLGSEDGSMVAEVRDVTVLEEVLSSLCSHHRLLLYYILNDVQQDHRSETQQCCCPDNHFSGASTLPITDCHVTASICCRTSFRLAKCSNHTHSSENAASTCIEQGVCSKHCLCCAHLPSCQHQYIGDHDYFCHTKDVLLTCQGACKPRIGFKRSHNLFPPARSPKPLDVDQTMAVNSNVPQFQDSNALTMVPPSVLPHKTENEEKTLNLNTALGCEKLVMLRTQAEKDDHQCGSFISDLMDRVTEKLKKVQPRRSQKEPNLPAILGQTPKARGDTHLTEIITTVLHNSTDKDYNLTELLEQHLSSEQQSPKTRLRKRKKTFLPDLPSSPKPDPSYLKKKTRFGRETCVKPFERTDSVEQSVKGPSKKSTTNMQNVQKSQKCQETLPQQLSLTEHLPHSKRSKLQGKDPNALAIHKEKCLPLQVSRSRRNIVPPQRFSSYVTEPRRMHFAACFSESIFAKHSSKDGATTVMDSTPESIFAIEPFDTKDEQLCSVPQYTGSRKYEIVSEKELPCEDKVIVREHEDNSRESNSSKRCLRANGLSNDAHSPTMFTVTTTGAPQGKPSPSSNSYESPIKLMFVSSVSGEDGVKYTLKAPSSASDLQCEMFDPCVEPSWAAKSTDEHNQVAERTVECVGKQTTVSPGGICPNSSNDGPVMPPATPIKRCRGRPKKMGPHLVKSEKRPIGRPPKPKVDLSSSDSVPGTDSLSRSTEMSPSLKENKNLKITILYGRSRRSRRLVSSSFPAKQDLGEEGKDSNTSKKQMTKNQLKDLHVVIPPEDQKCIYTSSKIKCQSQSHTNVSRKPGRPPKVKISGISVTVTTGSPRRRKIHIKRETQDSPGLRRRFVDSQPCKEKKAIANSTDMNENAVTAPKEHSQKTRGQPIPVRHSVRERKPSAYLLHSVATARSCALIRRSRKLLLNKASCEASQLAHSILDEPRNNALSTKAKNVCSKQDTVHFFTISVDSIFTSNKSFRWWPTSALPETLNEELSRRIKLMSNTWVSDLHDSSAESSTDFKPKIKEHLKGSPKKSPSAVKMLFEKDYNMQKLGTWFMQSTETQSLKIVKKATARNPKDVFHYSLSRPKSKVNVCPSPQAERLRKHVKKFAQVVPKSPLMQEKAQEMLSARLHAKRRLFVASSFKPSHGIQQQISRPGSTWTVYRKTLLRARQQFKTTSKMSVQDKGRHKHTMTLAPGAKTVTLLKDTAKLLKSTRPVTKSQNAVRSQITTHTGISSEAWSPASLKECRVFLKKINSANPRRPKQSWKQKCQKKKWQLSTITSNQAAQAIKKQQGCSGNKVVLVKCLGAGFVEALALITTECLSSGAWLSIGSIKCHVAKLFYFNVLEKRSTSLLEWKMFSLFMLANTKPHCHDEDEGKILSGG
ncbi:hypothetical protein DNTS_029616 [Danionella cerebrum]|uniref:Uncharacterized protein n=1 Tax=Danionella cerebrum TaxID=2873325 RepID=A0A553N5Q3_9TELE|nr:hypothetical protein DNTS_029616 [Danionella translucida]